jgi:hypothetical protein
MKNLITLILSAVLLCPMWAGAQTTTTPSFQGQLHYSGNLEVLDYFLMTSGEPCNSITNLRFNIQSPNNASPIKYVSGYLNCSNGPWSTISGALVATNGNLPNTANATTTGYTGTFTLGFDKMICNFPANLSSVFCRFYFFNGNRTGQLGSGTFNYTSAP